MSSDLSQYPEDAIPAIRQVMMPRDTNAVGTIFGGVILSQIDLAAAIEAHKHHPGKVVTVSMDKIDFKAPVFVGDLVSFFTETTHIGRTSIGVHVSVWAQRRFGGGFRRTRQPQEQAQPAPQPAVPQENPAEAAQRRQEIRENLQEYQMEVIRSGMPPLPIPLTEEMDAQLVAEGVLEPIAEEQ